ncbi:hypothetical protein HMPREF0216_01559 [Clostridium celatum DSM 1785]|uniref:Cell division protein FtsL n=2 Tax=Clostridium celatum TaxID=36834 RepID=L1QG93_9CLOT|nr:hypothetical protein [Clostridium celatum]EKY26956.1 hypothetical protein HMPREF0216_01559 [Clostridium celatum DSM 1785]MCE9654784.1 hypothetical protein [Clostridium celatum]
MGVREYDYIRGNTALVPERKIKEKERQREEQKRAIEKKNHLKRKQFIKNTFKVASLAFILSFIVLLIDGYVYKLQENLTTIEDAVREELDVNEALKVDMLQFAAFDVVKSAAEEIGMVYPKEESTISIDMSKEYFSHIKEEEKGNSSLFGKLIEIFN